MAPTLSAPTCFCNVLCCNRVTRKRVWRAIVLCCYTMHASYVHIPALDTIHNHPYQMLPAYMDSLTVGFGWPYMSKRLTGGSCADALSPLDLIPDVIPVLGLLDDLIILPGLIWLAIRLIPPQVSALPGHQLSADHLLRLRVSQCLCTCPGKQLGSDAAEMLTGWPLHGMHRLAEEGLRMMQQRRRPMSPCVTAQTGSRHKPRVCLLTSEPERWLSRLRRSCRMHVGGRTVSR